MNSSGSAEVTEKRARPPLLPVILIGLALLAAVIIGVTVLPVLYGVIAPPVPPVPNNATEVSRDTQDYGVDVTLYTAPDDPCSIIEYYEQIGARCVFAPLQCGDLQETIPGFERVVTGECFGQQAFSIFDMEWSARIFRLQPDNTTEIEMAREIFWIGSGRN